MVISWLLTVMYYTVEIREKLGYYCILLGINIASFRLSSHSAKCGGGFDISVKDIKWLNSLQKQRIGTVIKVLTL